MAGLEHARDRCTGDWRLSGPVGERVIRCERCEQTYPATSQNRLVAIDENYAGIYLRRLTAEGQEKYKIGPPIHP